MLKLFLRIGLAYASTAACKSENDSCIASNFVSSSTRVANTSVSFFISSSVSMDSLKPTLNKYSQCSLKPIFGVGDGFLTRCLRCHRAALYRLSYTHHIRNKKLLHSYCKRMRHLLCQVRFIVNLK